MSDPLLPDIPMLLVEPVALLRRTVSMTARSLGLLRIEEAASSGLALQLLHDKVFHGAVIAIDAHGSDPIQALRLVDEIRNGMTASKAAMPIAVMVELCPPILLTSLKERGVTHIILKPFRARTLIDTFIAFANAPRISG